MTFGLLPEPLVRWGIRRLLSQRLRQEARRAGRAAIEAELSRGPVAHVSDPTNVRHDGLPVEFVGLVLGPRLIHSGAYWPEGVSTLDLAEDAMLELVCSRAQLADGQDVLELGCGWGALSLWMAQRYPNSRIVAIATSPSQRQFIEARQAANLEVVTADINTLSIDRRFDRVVSIELFERMQNWRELLRRITGWLEPGGKLFVHLCCHRRYAYRFETEGVANWMGRHFLTGAVMPSLDLLPRLQGTLVVERTWEVSGEHYARTAAVWAANLAARRAAALAALAHAYGAAAPRWYGRWRIFLLACAELFAYRGGGEWLVGHYRLRKP